MPRRLAASIAALFGPLASAAAQSPGTDIFAAGLRTDDRIVAFSEWTNVTARPGYDNQPGFTPDGAAILYTSERDGQTDIYRFSLASGRTERVTRTPESEYSPTVMPGGERFSVVRVEADSTQRLWSFALDGGSPELVLPDLAPVGYHAWISERTLALFVLGDPPTLRLAGLGEGAVRTAAHDVGRSLHRVPGRRAVAFLHRDGGVERIRALHLETGRSRAFPRPPGEAEDFAWTPSGVLLAGSGSRLFALDPLTDDTWRLVADLSPHGIVDVTRIAVSPDGSNIAVVGADAPSP